MDYKSLIDNSTPYILLAATFGTFGFMVYKVLNYYKSKEERKGFTEEEEITGDYPHIPKLEEKDLENIVKNGKH